MMSNDIDTEVSENSSKTDKKTNSHVNVLSSNIFNSTEENKERLPWRNLTNERRVEILNRYFESDFNNKNTSKTIDANTIYMILELASKGRLKLKKEVTYDKINERIIQIHALSSEPHTDNYVYKPETLIKKEKSKKIAKNILFRKR